MDLPIIRSLGLGLRNKNLTQIYVAVTLVICLASGALHHHIGLYLFVLFGTLWAWVYLRFFKVFGTTPGGAGGGAQLRGDPREEFSFASLFPVRSFLRIAFSRRYSIIGQSPLNRMPCAGDRASLSSFAPRQKQPR